MPSFDADKIKEALLYALERNYKFHDKHKAKGLLQLSVVLGTAQLKLMNDGVRPLPKRSTLIRYFDELVTEGKAEHKVVKVRRVHTMHFVKPKTSSIPV